MVVLTDYSKSVQEDEEVAAEYQELQQAFFEQWYHNNQDHSSTSYFGKFSNRVQIDYKFELENNVIYVSNYTALSDDKRHLRDDGQNGVQRNQIAFADAKEAMLRIARNDENSWLWNGDEVHYDGRESEKVQCAGCTMFYSSLFDLTQFVDVNGASETMDLFVATDAHYFQDEVLDWYCDDKQVCSGSTMCTGTASPYRFLPTDMCALDINLKSTFDNVVIFPIGVDDTDELGCKMGSQMTKHLTGTCGAGHETPFDTQFQSSTISELTDAISHPELSQKKYDEQCCRSGILEVEHEGTIHQLKKDYDVAQCGSVYKTERYDGAFNNYPVLYYTESASGGAWIFATSGSQFVSSYGNNVHQCCPKNDDGTFVNASDFTVSCQSPDWGPFAEKSAVEFDDSFSLVDARF